MCGKKSGDSFSEPLEKILGVFSAGTKAKLSICVPVCM
jgi:hypothetical protein